MFDNPPPTTYCYILAAIILTSLAWIYLTYLRTVIPDVSLTPPLRRLLRFGGRLSPGPGLGGNLGRLVFYLLQVNVSLASPFRSLGPDNWGPLSLGGR